jgi:hypothetical protein
MEGSAMSNICDCERSQNGLGMAGRECDCHARNPQPKYMMVRIWDEEYFKYVDTYIDIGIDGFKREVVEEFCKPPLYYVTSEVL